MPLYDLVCGCGYVEFDKHISVAEYGKAMCPECGNKLKSKIYQMTFTTKGAGWTPVYHGIDRTDRTRESFLKEEMYEAEKMKKKLKAQKQRENEKKPIYIT